MAMTYEQITKIIEDNGGMENLVVVINDAGSTINLTGVDKSKVIIDQVHGTFIYPVWDNELDMELVAHLSLDSLADIRMIPNK